MAEVAAVEPGALLGGQLFVGSGGNLENEYSILGNLFGRSDTPSGLGTPALPAQPASAGSVRARTCAGASMGKAPAWR